jgi:acetylornithine deacetylase/succinyl-diaminopimelate desuccinylase-like protein
MSGPDPMPVVELAQRLIRFDTTNPPGNERACIEFIAGLLERAGVETTVRSRDPQRPNLIARLPGSGRKAPLLLHGHVDVVPAAAREWRHGPFSGDVVDGELWGRGAIDMKGGVAMMLSAVLRLAASETKPAGDVIFAALSDEEGGSSYGAKFLVEAHAELFDGVRHAVGEFGGVARPAHAGSVYLVPVAEKQWCSLKIALSGSGGHAAMPSRGGAVAKLATVLGRIEDTRLPLQVCEVAGRMIDEYAEALEPDRAEAIRALKDADRSDALLDAANGALALFDAALHNTATPTVIRGGERSDAIPDTIEICLDGRVLPDNTPEDLVRQLRDVVGPDAEIELVHSDVPARGTSDMSLLPALAEALEQLDPGARVVPMLNPGVTDGRFFARLGIQHHGFLPMQLADPGPIIATMHGVDERVPVSALEFGTGVYERLMSGPK